MQLLILVALTQLAMGVPFPRGNFDYQGLLDGNRINSAIHAPVNSCKNDVTTIGGNSHFFSNSCSNISLETGTDDHSNSNNGSESYPDTSTDTNTDINNYPDTDSDTTTYPEDGDNEPITDNVVNTPLYNPVNKCNNSVSYNGEVPIYDHSCVNISVQTGNDDHSNQ